MGYRPKDQMIPEYIARQWEEMSMDERRAWLKWTDHQRMVKWERLHYETHPQPCYCFECRVYKARSRTKWCRDGEIRRRPKPPRWKKDGK